MPPKRQASEDQIQPKAKRLTRNSQKEISSTQASTPKSSSTSSSSSSLTEIVEEEDVEEKECSICYENYQDDYGVLKCKHAFCFSCISQWSNQKNSCPLCNGIFKEISHYNFNKYGKNKKGKLNHKKIRIKFNNQRRYNPPPHPSTRIIAQPSAHIITHPFELTYLRGLLNANDNSTIQFSLFNHRNNSSTINLVEDNEIRRENLSQQPQIVDLTLDSRNPSSSSNLNSSSSNPFTSSSTLVDLLDEDNNINIFDSSEVISIE